MPCTIVKGRIDGTRITVWDVFQYVVEGCTTDEILDELPVTLSQLQAAMDFIRNKLEYVAEGHRKIEERNARGNPPEIEGKVKQSRTRMRQWLRERRGVLR